LITSTSTTHYSPQDSLISAVFTARRSYANTALGVVILSVCLSITRKLCDKTKRCTADILIPY